MTPQNKLYEAAMALIGDLINRRSHFNSFQNLCRVLCEYEQEQPEAIAGEKTIDEIWKEWCEKDISWTDAALGAMRDFASQQTAHKDQKITDLSGELHATDKLNQELQDEIAELKQRIYELEKLNEFKNEAI